MALDMTSADPILKVHYGGQNLKNMVYTERPLLALIPKYENFGGRHKPLPIKYASTQNRSTDFTFANRSAAAVSGYATSSAVYEEFLLTRSKNYAYGQIDGETIAAANGGINSFVDALTSEMDSVVDALSDDVHYSLYADSTGFRAVAATACGAGALAATEFQVTNGEDLHSIEVGMLLTFATASPTAALDNSGEVQRVTAVDRSAGTITLDADWSGTIAAGDYIFAAGDRPAASLSANNRTRVYGLSDWLPATVTPGESFFGVDRSLDRDKLAGIYHDGSSQTLQEALKDAHTKIAAYGGKASHVFMNHKNLGDLINELGTKVEYDVVRDSTGIFGFESVKVRTTKGVVPVVADHMCPVNTAFMLDMRCVGLHSAGPAIRLLNSDKNQILRVGLTADAYGFNFGGYMQLGIDAPGRCARIALPTAA